MDSAWIFAGVSLSAAWGLLRAYRSYTRRDAVSRRIAARAERRPLKEVRDGALVRVTGRLRAATEPLRTPLAGRACVLYASEVRRIDEDTTADSIRVLHHTASVDFVIEDASGQALVRKGTARSLSPQVFRPEHESLKAPTSSLLRLSASAGVDCERHWFPGYFQMEERYQPLPSEDVEIVGIGMWEPDPEGASIGYREAAHRLVLLPPKGDDVLVL